MPKRAQKDIFEFADHAELLVVFGHLGFNEMNVKWREFCLRFPGAERVDGAFSSLDAAPHEYAPGKFIVTINDQRNGMSDEALRDLLIRQLRWATDNGIRRLATNGIINTDHTSDAASVRSNDDRRARLLIEWAVDGERDTRCKIVLSSLSGVFTRNQYQ